MVIQSLTIRIHNQNERSHSLPLVLTFWLLSQCVIIICIRDLICRQKKSSEQLVSIKHLVINHYANVNQNMNSHYSPSQSQEFERVQFNSAVNQRRNITSPERSTSLIVSKYRYLLEALRSGELEKVDVQKLFDLCK